MKPRAAMPRERGSRSRSTASPSRASAISIDGELPAESVTTPYAWRPAGKQRPAPAAGGHSCEIRRELLVMDYGEIDDLASRGVVRETGTRREPAAVAMHKETHG